MSIIDIDPSWSHMLTNIQCLLGMEAFIAGGALRDTYFNKPIADIDIFVYAEPNTKKDSNQFPISNKSSWDIALDVCNGEQIVFEYNDGSIINDTKQNNSSPHPPTKGINGIFAGNILSAPCVSSTPVYSYGGKRSNNYVDSNIKAVFSILKTDGTMYQIIYLKIHPKIYIEQYFDIGLCKIYFDGKRVVLTPDFITDATNNTLTLCGKFNQLTLHRSVNYHIPKLLKKYPNRQVIFDPKVFS